MLTRMDYATIKLKPCYTKITGTEKFLLALSIPTALIGYQTNFFWHTLGIEAIILGSQPLKRWFRLHNIRKYDISDTDSMDGISFEIWLEVLFRDLGHKVLRTKPSGDLKADLILDTKNSRTVIQAKKRANSTVGTKAIDEALEAKENYKAGTAMVVTNQYFAGTAIEKARNNNVILTNRDDLENFLHAARENRFPRNLKKFLPKRLPRIIRVKI